MKFGMTSLILIFSLPVLAEYRVFQYLVKTHDPFAVANKAEPKYIVSTLNPQMYQSYHGGSKISVDLLRTWICPGYTGLHTPYCDHPYDKKEKATP